MSNSVRPAEEYVDFTSTDPVKWTRVYLQGFMINLAYFTGLIACIRTSHPADIIACVPDECLEEFKDYVNALNMSDSSDGLYMLKGGEPPFGIQEVRQLAAWLKEHPNGRANLQG